MQRQCRTAIRKIAFLAAGLVALCRLPSTQARPAAAAGTQVDWCDGPRPLPAE